MNRRPELRVLVVDDHQDLGETLKAVLEVAGCAVDAATTPFAGITLSNLQRYDLVLVDFKMPQMDGVALLDHLRPRGHGCILMMTGYPDDLNPAAAAAGGAQGVLRKPLEISRLLALVESVRSQAGSHAIRIAPDLLEARRQVPA